MILDNEYLYNSILERMPYFSLKSTYNDLVKWYSDIEQLKEYAPIYELLIEGEFYYDIDNNNIYSTIPISDMNITNNKQLYITNMDECLDFIDYCKLINSHPIEHPIYTRTIILDNNDKFNGQYQLKYCRPTNIRNKSTNEIFDENYIESIQDIYPEFDLRRIYDLVMDFGFYSKSNTVCEYFITTNQTYINDNMIDEIADIYAFGPNNDNIGKSIMIIPEKI